MSATRPRDRSPGGTLGTLTSVSVQLNHTIVSCRDQQRSAAFLTGTVGLPPATRFAHFLVVQAHNGASLDYAETIGEIALLRTRGAEQEPRHEPATLLA
jgi:hypothetical protein